MVNQDAPVVVGVAATTVDDPVSLAFAAALAARRGAPVVLVHATHGTPEHPTTLPLLNRDDRRAVGQDILDKAQQRVRDFSDGAVEVHTELADSGIVPALLEASHGASLVVLRRRDLSSLERVFTGSIITGVAARAACPVVCVPSGWDPTTVRDRVVVGLDDAALSPEALDYAFPAAEERKATLHVLYAWRAPTVYDDIIFARTNEASWREETRQHLEQQLSPWRDRHRHVRVEIDVDYARPAQALAQASRSSDLLVLGRRTRPLPGGLALGSVSRALVSATECPLVIAPHPDDTAG